MEPCKENTSMTRRLPTKPCLISSDDLDRERITRPASSTGSTSQSYDSSAVRRSHTTHMRSDAVIRLICGQTQSYDSYAVRRSHTTHMRSDAVIRVMNATTHTCAQ